MANFDQIESDFLTDRLKSQMRFIAEVDKLKQILRRTILTDQSRQENDAEHSWHLALMAAILKEYAKEPFNMERVLKMLIFHDLIEIYAGDTFAFDKTGNIDKEKREKDAADKLFAILPKDQAKEFRALWEEFDKMQTRDAKYAAALDRLQPFLHNALTDGHTWRLGKVTKQDVLARMQPTVEALPALAPFIFSTVEKHIKQGYILEN